MRFIEKALYTKLTTHSGLTALVSTRVYNTVAPQGVTFPCVLFQKMGGFHVADNPKENLEAVYVVKAVASDLSQAENVDFQIKEALDRQSLTVNTDGYADYKCFRGMNLHFLEDVEAGVVVFHVGALYEIGAAETQS